MADVCDRADSEIDRHIRQSLAAVQSRPAEEPLLIDGFRCCLDCEDIIPINRLNSLPDAVRCISCQEDKERHDGR